MTRLLCTAALAVGFLWAAYLLGMVALDAASLGGV